MESANAENGARKRAKTRSSDADTPDGSRRAVRALDYASRVTARGELEMVADDLCLQLRAGGESKLLAQIRSAPAIPPQRMRTYVPQSCGVVSGARSQRSSGRADDSRILG